AAGGVACIWVLSRGKLRTEGPVASQVSTEHAFVAIPDREETLQLWVEEFSGADEAAQQTMLARGVELARKRRTVMRRLMREHPDEAIRHALTLAEWLALPAEIRSLVEEPFSARAQVGVLISCGDTSSDTQISTVLPDGTVLDTFVYGRRRELATKNNLPVQGIRLDDLAVLRESVFQILDSADEAVALALYETANPDAARCFASGQPLGSDAVAALVGGKVFHFKNATVLEQFSARLAALEDLPGPSAGSQALFDALGKGFDEDGFDLAAVEAAAMEASEAWTGSPRDMYVILIDFPDMTGSPVDPVALSTTINTAVSRQIQDMSYGKTHIVGTVNPTTYRMPDVSSSYTNAEGLLHADAVDAVQAVGVDLSPYETVCVFFGEIEGIGWAGLAEVGGSRLWLHNTPGEKTITHELGHNYGLRHASAWAVTGSDPADPDGALDGDGEYGDFMDIMGRGQVPPGHFNAFHKQRLNWLGSNHWTNIANSGTYRIFRSDHSSTDPFAAALRGLKIDKGDGGEYWLGLRQEYTEYDHYGRGAYVLWKKPSDNRSYLLDMTPGSADGKYDGGLALGQTYSDGTAQVHITPVARGGRTPNEWMDITVNKGSFPGNTAPMASLSGPTNMNVRESVVYRVTASDSDGDELAYYWDFGDGDVKGNTPVMAHAWLSGVAGTVRCVVSDMKGGIQEVSQSVTLSDPLVNWTERTSGTAYTLNDITAGNGLMVAVGDKGTTVVSADGINWSVGTVGGFVGNLYLKGIIYDGAKFIAVGWDYDYETDQNVGTVYTSTDGHNWFRRHFEGYKLYDVAYGGGVYVACGSQGEMIRSTSGYGWSTVREGTDLELRGVAYGDGTFIIVGDNFKTHAPHIVLTSPDGLNWTDRTSGTVMDDWKRFYTVQYCHDRFLASGHGVRVRSSTNHGQTFEEQTTEYYWAPGFAYGSGIYLAAGDNQSTGDDINLLSLDGVNWTELATADQQDRNAAVYFNNTFVTVGSQGSIWQSDPIGELGEGWAMWQYCNRAILGFDRDPDCDPDLDGCRNLTEYALGSLPGDPSSFRRANCRIDEAGHLEFTISRNGIAGDMGYIIERSADLLDPGGWSAVETVLVSDTAEALTVRSAVVVDAQDKEFLRLKLQFK
ncbi:MAG: hypothetical protein K9M45_02420, partial [Kiritimatiellales bacterium]|nr:hypothetical protein [Kiritimatiellales bacterium]